MSSRSEIGAKSNGSDLAMRDDRHCLSTAIVAAERQQRLNHN